MTQAIEFEILKVGHCNHPECVAMRGGRLKNIRFPALCGLLRHPEQGTILYDTGYADHFITATRQFPECLYRRITPVTLPKEEQLLSQLAERGIQAADINWIIISHFHADHIAGIRDFPGARFLAYRSEYDEVCNQSRFKRLRRAFLRDLLPGDFNERVRFLDAEQKTTLDPGLAPFTEGVDIFADGSIMAIDLPGHTASQMGIVFQESDGRRWFLVGDACWGMAALEKNQRPIWLARRIFADQKKYNQSFEKLRQLHLRADGLQILPSHCDQSWKSWCASKN